MDVRDAEDAIRRLDGFQGWRVEFSRQDRRGGGRMGIDRGPRGRSPPPNRSRGGYRERSPPPRRRSPSYEPYKRRSPSYEPVRRRSLSISPRRRRSPSYEREEKPDRSP